MNDRYLIAICFVLIAYILYKQCQKTETMIDLSDLTNDQKSQLIKLLNDLKTGTLTLDSLTVKKSITVGEPKTEAVAGYNGFINLINTDGATGLELCSEKNNLGGSAYFYKPPTGQISTGGRFSNPPKYRIHYELDTLVPENIILPYAGGGVPEGWKVFKGTLPIVKINDSSDLQVNTPSEIQVGTPTPGSQGLIKYIVKVSVPTMAPKVRPAKR